MEKRAKLGYLLSHEPSTNCVKVSVKIKVKTLENKILTFNNVVEHCVKDGFLVFTDSLNGKQKIFPVNNCEIDPEVEVSNENF